MAEAFAGDVPIEEEEEEIEDLPENLKKKDDLFGAKISRTVDGVVFQGEVEEIEVGKTSGERLYRIKYTDGDLEHLTADQVRSMSIDPDEFVGKAMKKPAG